MNDPARWLGHKRVRRVDPRDALKEVDWLTKEVEDLKRELRELKEKEKGQWLLGPPRIGY
jgi:hypothetical protein